MSTFVIPISESSDTTSRPSTIHSPCAACKILRRRCTESCILAPYFPPSEPFKFAAAHRVFGASNIIRSLQELPASHRADAVSSMVYEANARTRDPVYGCAGAVFHLQKEVKELQAQLARAQAELVNVQAHHANLLALICMEVAQKNQQSSLAAVGEVVSGSQIGDLAPSYGFHSGDASRMDESNIGNFHWDEPLWLC